MWIIIDSATEKPLYRNDGRLVEFETEQAAQRYASSLPSTIINFPGSCREVVYDYKAVPR